MTKLLHTLDQPHGRCLLLAQKLHQVTGIAASDCVQIAERLFASQHPRDHPATVEVQETSLAEELEAICAGLGISVENAARGKSVAGTLS